MALNKTNTTDQGKLADLIVRKAYDSTDLAGYGVQVFPDHQGK
jgi:hypothetical protein